MLNIFLCDNFFEKSSIFWEKRAKLFWEHIWQFFRERRRLALKINVTFFITNEIPNILLFSSFFKKSCIFWENGKNHFWGPSLFWRKEAFGDKNEYNLFYGKWGFEYFSSDNFFEKGTFWEKMGKKFYGDWFLGFWFNRWLINWKKKIDSTNFLKLKFLE